MTRKIVTWVLVADGERARVLENLGPGKGLHPAMNQEFVNLRSGEDHFRDAPPRVHQRVGGGRAAVDEVEQWHRFEKARFAKDLAKTLGEQVRENKVDRLVLIAPPKALGDLREALDAATRELVIATVDKDLTHMDDRQIGAQLDGIIVV